MKAGDWAACDGMMLCRHGVMWPFHRVPIGDTGRTVDIPIYCEDKSHVEL